MNWDIVDVFQDIDEKYGLEKFWRTHLMSIVFVILLASGLLFSLLGFSLSYLTEIVIFALAAYGVLFLYGYVNLLTFGHAMFFGAGAYVTTILINETELNIWLIVLVTIIALGILAAIVGYFSLKQTALYFAILTLAFAEVFRFLMIDVLGDYTGGHDGLPGAIVRPSYEVGFLAVNLNDAWTLYAVTAIILVLWLALMRGILNSQLGLVFLAIRENENRAKALGYDTTLYQTYAFTLSGIVTGAGGILYSLYLGFAGPDHLHWVISAELLFIVMLGGAFNLLGAIVGAGIFLGLRSGLSNFFTWWQLPIGILLIVIIIFSPEGITGLIKKKVKWERE